MRTVARTGNEFREVIVYVTTLCVLSCSHTHLLSSFSGQALVTGKCRPFLPPVLAFNFLSRLGFRAIPLIADFSSSVANSRARPSVSICAQENVTANLYEFELGGIRSHETDL